MLNIIANSCSKTTPKAILGYPRNPMSKSGIHCRIVPEKSYMEWTGYYQRSQVEIDGIFIPEGSISLLNGKVSGGKIWIDMNTILSNNQPKGNSHILHNDFDRFLKSDLFFNVSKFPLMTFVLTDVNPSRKCSVKKNEFIINGNLKIKGKILNVCMPAKITIKEGSFDLESTFTINRDELGLDYGLGNTAEDWIISPEIYIDIKIFAKQ